MDLVDVAMNVKSSVLNILGAAIVMSNDTLLTLEQPIGLLLDVLGLTVVYYGGVFSVLKL